MKRILSLFIALAIALATVCYGKVVKADSTVKTEKIQNSKPTGFAYEDRDGNKFRIYQGSKGGFFYMKTAKSGKKAGQPTKRYLNKEDKQTVTNNLNTRKS